MSEARALDITALPRRCVRCRRSILRLGSPPSICLKKDVSHSSARNGCNALAARTLHDTSERIQHSLACEVLRGNQVDEVLLPAFLLRLG